MFFTSKLGLKMMVVHGLTGLGADEPAISGLSFPFLKTMCHTTLVIVNNM